MSNHDYHGRSITGIPSYSDSSIASSLSTIPNQWRTQSARTHRPPFQKPLRKIQRKYNKPSRNRDASELWYYQPRHSVSFISPWRPVDLNAAPAAPGTAAQVPIQEMTRDEVMIVIEDEFFNQIKPNENGCTKFCCRDSICGNKLFQVDPEFQDPEIEGCFILKIFMIKAFQMMLAFWITFYFQGAILTTNYGPNGEVELPEKSAWIQALDKYSWTVYIASFLYGFCWSITRIMILKFNTALIILMFWIQTILIIYIAFMLGIIFKLALVSVFLLSLSFNYVVIGILPLACSKFLIRKNCSSLFWISTLSLLCLTLSSWYFLTMILMDTNSEIGAGFIRADTMEKLVLYWLPTFGAAEIFMAMVHFDMKSILNGERFPVTQSTWLIGTVYI